MKNADEEKIDILIRLIGALIIDRYENTTDKVEILDRLGLDRKDIAKICDTTPDTVRALSSSAKRRPKKKSKIN